MDIKQFLMKDVVLANHLFQKWIEILSRRTFNFFELYYTSIKKVLALDLDNTLWGGIIGQGISGIKISSDGYGKSFYDFQKEILNLKKEVFYLLFAVKTMKQMC